MCSVVVCCRRLVSFAYNHWRAAVTVGDEIRAEVVMQDGSPSNYFACFRNREHIEVCRNRKRCIACKELVAYLETRYKRCLQGCDNRYNYASPSVKLQLTQLNHLTKQLEDARSLLADNELAVAKLNCAESLNDEDSAYLVDLLSQVLKYNMEFNSNCFLYKLIKQQLQCLLPSTTTKTPNHPQQRIAQSMRWDPDIIHWMMSIQYLGGEGVVNLLRG